MLLKREFPEVPFAHVFDTLDYISARVESKPSFVRARPEAVSELTNLSSEVLRHAQVKLDGMTELHGRAKRGFLPRFLQGPPTSRLVAVDGGVEIINAKDQQSIRITSDEGSSMQIEVAELSPRPGCVVRQHWGVEIGSDLPVMVAAEQFVGIGMTGTPDQIGNWTEPRYNFLGDLSVRQVDMKLREADRIIRAIDPRD